MHKSNWEMGKLSGYPPCCNVFFHIRLKLYVQTGLVSKVWRRWPPRGGPGYIQCPVHAVQRKLGKKFKHSICSECGWAQLNGGPCRVKADHKGWVTREIREDIKKQLKDRGYIWFGRDGKIWHRTVRELTK